MVSKAKQQETANLCWECRFVLQDHRTFNLENRFAYCNLSFNRSWACMDFTWHFLERGILDHSRLTPTCVFFGFQGFIKWCIFPEIAIITKYNDFLAAFSLNPSTPSYRVSAKISLPYQLESDRPKSVMCISVVFDWTWLKHLAVHTSICVTSGKPLYVINNNHIFHRTNGTYLILAIDWSILR